MCNYLLHNFFLKNAKNLGRSNEAKRSKRGRAYGDKKNYATPTNEDLGQTSNWAKLVAAYLPVARPTILDRLVFFSAFSHKSPSGLHSACVTNACLRHRTEVVVVKSY